MAGAHTPAPWLMASAPSSVVGWPIVGPDGRLICNLGWIGPDARSSRVSDAQFTAYRSEVEANGRVIAVAPELLAALEAMVEAYREGCDDEDEPSMVREALRLIAAARDGRTS